MERMDREYMPLDGDELVQVIERMVGGELRKHEHLFGKHLVRHNPLIRVAVKVDCYTPERTPTDGGFELAVALTDGPIMEPDRIREQLGLGTYETKLVDEYSGTLADVKTGERDMQPDAAATIEKVNKLLEATEEPAAKPRPRPKTKRARKRSGWPKGKKRGPRSGIVPPSTPEPIAAEA